MCSFIYTAFFIKKCPFYVKWLQTFGKFVATSITQKIYVRKTAAPANLKLQNRFKYLSTSSKIAFPLP
jgi:hypothetical protein